MQVRDFLSRLGERAPDSLAEEWDNVGLLVGRPEAEMSSVLVALDLRPEVLAQAVADGHGAILTHHPLIFPVIDSVSPVTLPGALVLEAAEAHVAVIAAHTNLDSARGGLNDLMAEALGVSDAAPLTPDDDDPEVGLGRVGMLAEPVRLGDLATRADDLWPSGARITGDPTERVQRIALCTGSGAGLIDAARLAGADAYITCDLKYHDADRAGAMALIGLDHAAVEAPLLALWAEAFGGLLEPEGCRVVLAEASTSPWSGPASR